MGLCGAKTQVLDSAPSTPRIEPPQEISVDPAQLKGRALLLRRTTSSESTNVSGQPGTGGAHYTASGSGDVSVEADDRPDECEAGTQRRLRSCSTWNSVATEASQWRARFVMESRGSVEQHYNLSSQKLGQGSYGYVCGAVSRDTGSVRAVKCLSKAESAGVRKRFRQEVEIMKGVDHPNIVRLVETYEDKEHIFLVMELCRGGDLQQNLVRHGPCCEATAASLMQQILRPICYMHQKRLCHRDIKPENFLLLGEEPLENCTLKLADFGFSCQVEPGQLLSAKLGTPKYLSPQVLAGSYDQSCDLWSCGVLLYVLLSGDAPFDGRREEEVLQLIRRGNYRFSSPVWRSISEGAKGLIRMLLKYHPEERFTAEQALADFWIIERACPANWDANLRHGMTVSAPCPQVEGGQWRSAVLPALHDFCQQHQLRQATLQILARQLPEDETQDLRELFTSLDARGLGVLSVAQLAEDLQEDFEGSTHQWAQTVQDLKGDDTVAEVGYTDFLAAMLSTRCAGLPEGAFRAAFRGLDRNGDGRISPDELVSLLQGHFVEMDPAKAEALRQIRTELDTNHDGFIDFEEFKQMLFSEN